MTISASDLAKSIARHGLTGASFAYWDGAALHCAVAGERNSVTGDPVTIDTVMHIGSITKVLNAVLLLQLVDDGLVSLDDPVVRHLPELRIGDEAALARITCAMLLNHQSGIDGDWLPEFDPDRERIADAVARCAGLGQLFAPGSATSYCNIATVLAGYLVERVRSQSWYRIVKQRIFEPLGMRHTLAELADIPRFRCSVGDLTNPDTGDRFQTSRPFLSPSFAPAGSTIMASASDLVTFARTMLHGGVAPNGARILSAAATARMEVPCGRFLFPAFQMGLGWMIAPGEILTHSGVGPGVFSYLFAHRASGQAIALLTNSDRGNLLKADLIDPVLAGWMDRSATPPGSPGKIDAARYAGIYTSNLNRVEVSTTDEGLAVRQTMLLQLYDNSPHGEAAARSRPRAMRALGDDTFEVDALLPGGANAQMKFGDPDDDGRMQVLGTGYRLLRRI